MPMPADQNPVNSDRRSADAGPCVTLSFEGREIRCNAGATLAAVLVAAGVREFRESVAGSRGLFCGMGVCQECLVSVDGVTGQRACMTLAEHGQQVVRQPLHASLGAGKQFRSYRPVAMQKPDVLVAGAGPAGLAAAIAAADAGATVTVIDERSRAGGQYYKQPYAGGALPESLRNDRQVAEGRCLIERAQRAGAEIVSNALVWGGFPGPEIRALVDGRQVIFRPRQLIVATGAFEVAHTVPGWTLPGVMTTGAAQTLLRVNGTLPYGRVLVAGNGPLNLQVALELARAGAEVAGVAELAPRFAIGRARDALAMVASAPRTTLEGARILAGLTRRRIPVYFGHALACVSSRGNTLEADLAKLASKNRLSLEVDTVCLGYGFQPNNELLRLLGCVHDWEPFRRQFVTRRDVDCRTSVERVFAVGDCAGLGGAAAAQREGVIAGTAAARACGIATTEDSQAAARRGLRRERRFQAALWSLFAPAADTGGLTTAATLVCRCENVPAGTIEAAIASGSKTLASLKRRTRLGMGPCQGRYCIPWALARLINVGNKSPDEFDLPAPRAPLRPLPVSSFADGEPDD